eukprot:4594674-Lingulodinium_polyedra.AAC.1
MALRYHSSRMPGWRANLSAPQAHKLKGVPVDHVLLWFAGVAASTAAPDKKKNGEGMRVDV